MMCMETVTFNDMRHWRHSRLDDRLIEIGLTVYNADCYTKPISKWGQAPHDVLTYFESWDCLEMARDALRVMGFRTKNQIVWIREENDGL